MALTDVFTYYGTLSWDGVPIITPWRTDGWLWATQGHFLVALQDDGSEGIDAPEKYRGGAFYFSATPTQAETVLLDVLSAFVGPVTPSDVSCVECNGYGRDHFGDSHECEHCGKETFPACLACGGDGKAALPVRDVRIAGVPVNAVLLAFALSQVPVCADVTIGSVPSIRGNAASDYEALAVIGATWRIVLMGCRDVDGSVPSLSSVAERV